MILNQKPDHSPKRLIIPSAIVVGFIVAFFILKGLTQYWLNKQLPVLLNENPNRVYDIHFERAHLNFIERNLAIENIEISIVSDSINSNKATVEAFEIEKTALVKLFFRKEIETEKLVVKAPHFNIRSLQNIARNNEVEINEIWKDVFTRLSIHNLEIRSGLLSVIDSFNAEPSLLLSGLDISIERFSVDTATIKDPFPVKFEKLSASCSNASVVIDTIGILRMNGIKLTHHDARISALSFSPFLSSTDFLKVRRAKNDWISFDANRLELKSFRWMFGDDEVPHLNAALLKLESIALHGVSDMNFPKANNGRKPLLAELFRSLPVAFRLDSFQVLNSQVCFETKPFNQDTVGCLLIDQLYASGYNLHNEPDLFTSTEVDVVARLMGEAHLESKFKMNVNDKSNRFQVSGKVDNLTTLCINRILEPLAGVETAGQLYGLHFNILADNNHSTGNVDFEYDGLKVKVLRKNSSEKNVLLTTISNVALRKSNVSTDKRFKQGKINHQRDYQKSIFGFIWDSVKDGLLDTIVPFDLEKKERTWKKLKRKHA